MDGPQFDAWTRRRFGLVAGGALAAALSLSALDAGQARKKRKKRCRRINQSCKEDSKKRRCCKNLRCDEAKVISPTGLGCCRHFQEVCESEIECCTSFKCQPAVGLAGNRCCAPTGTFCAEVSDCCANMAGNVSCSNHTCTLSL